MTLVPCLMPPVAEAPPTTSDRIADTLLSGLAGLALLTTLRQLFPTARRDEVYLGVALAASIWEADRVGLLADLAAAEARTATP